MQFWHAVHTRSIVEFCVHACVWYSPAPHLVQFAHWVSWSTVQTLWMYCSEPQRVHDTHFASSAARQACFVVLPSMQARESSAVHGLHTVFVVRVHPVCESHWPAPHAAQGEQVASAEALHVTDAK